MTVLLEAVFAIISLLLLSSKQTVDAFRIWDIFSMGRSTTTTTEDYTYISVDKQELSDVTYAGQGNLNIKYKHDSLHEEANTFNLHKPTIRVTKTVTREIIAKVTVNPICVKTHTDKPACFRNDDVIKSGYLEHEFGNEFKEVNNMNGSLEKDMNLIDPSVHDTYDSVEMHKSKEALRDPKYFYFHKPTPGLSYKNTKIKEQLQIAEISDALAHARDKYKNVVTKEVEKTIWATRVQKVTNYGVTATLIVENCVPYGVMYPSCE